MLQRQVVRVDALEHADTREGCCAWPCSGARTPAGLQFGPAGLATRAVCALVTFNESLCGTARSCRCQLCCVTHPAQATAESPSIAAMPKNTKAVKAVQGSDQLPGKEKGLYQDAMVRCNGCGHADRPSPKRNLKVYCRAQSDLVCRNCGNARTTKRP